MRSWLTDQVRMFEKYQKEFLYSQIVASVYNNIVSGTFMTGLLLLIGANPSEAGTFLSIPLLANVFQLFLGKIWNYFCNYENTINLMLLITRLGILSIIFIPLVLGEQSIEIRILITGIILLFSYVFAASAGVHLNWWMVNSISHERQGVFFAFRDKIVVVVTLMVSFIAAVLTDYLKSRNKEYFGFAFAFLLAGLLAVTDYMLLNRIKHVADGKRKVVVQWHAYKRIWCRDHRFIRFAIYILFLNFSVNLANPYYNSYMLDALKLKYMTVIGLTALQVCAQIVAASFWAKMANSFCWSTILSVTTLVQGIQFLIWSMVTRDSLWLIVIIFISSGLISTGHVTGQFMIPYEYIDFRNPLTYLSMCTSIAAIGGFLGSLMGSGIISLYETKIWYLGKMQFGSMQLNMVISGMALMGTAFYARIVLKNKDTNT